jgi:hypothetical protein
LPRRHRFLHQVEPILVTSNSSSLLFPTISLPYLATTTSFHNSTSCDNNFYFHFARRLILTNRRSRTPNPPSFFDLQIIFGPVYQRWFKLVS